MITIIGHDNDLSIDNLAGKTAKKAGVEDEKTYNLIEDAYFEEFRNTSEVSDSYENEYLHELKDVLHQQDKDMEYHMIEDNVKRYREVQIADYKMNNLKGSLNAAREGRFDHMKGNLKRARNDSKRLGMNIPEGVDESIEDIFYENVDENIERFTNELEEYIENDKLGHFDHSYKGRWNTFKNHVEDETKLDRIEEKDERLLNDFVDKLKELEITYSDNLHYANMSGDQMEARKNELDLKKTRQLLREYSDSNLIQRKVGRFFNNVLENVGIKNE